MNDVLDRVRAVNPSHPPQPTDHEVATVVTEAIRRSQRPARRASFSRRALVLAGSVVAAVTAAVAGAVLVTGPPAAVAAPLNQLADEIVAASHPAPPQPYLYVRSRTETVKAVQDKGARVESASSFDETWLKLDDNRSRTWERASLTALAMRCEGDGSCPVSTGGFRTPTPAWARSLPSDPTALESLIRSEAKGDEFDQVVLHLLEYPAVPPEVRATLIRWLPDIRGLTVLGDRTVNGRAGVALSFGHGGTRTELVLERRTGVVLERLTRLHEPDQATYPGLPAGTVLERTVLLQMAYVAKPGASR